MYPFIQIIKKTLKFFFKKCNKKNIAFSYNYKNKNNGASTHGDKEPKKHNIKKNMETDKVIIKRKWDRCEDIYARE